MKRRTKYLIGGAAALVVIAGVAVFRPDTLFIDKQVEEVLDPQVAAAIAAAQTDPTTTMPSTPPASVQVQEPAASAAATTTAPLSPAVIAKGSWVSIEHETLGTVSVVEDGSRQTVVFNDLETSNGPDLAVYLSPTAPDRGGNYVANAVRLGPLKGNVGTQTYELPENVDVSSFASVVIWCERFSVGFGVAPLVGV